MFIKKTFNIDLSFNKTREIVVHGEKIRGALSPADFPRMANVTYDSAREILTIKFDYIEGGLEAQYKQEGPEIDLMIGMKTGRLYSIEIKCESLQEVPGKITLILEGLDRHLQREVQVTHQTYPYLESLGLAVARDFLSDSRTELARGLGAAG